MEKVSISINMDEIKPLDLPLRELRRHGDGFSLRKVYRDRVNIDE